MNAADINALKMLNTALKMEEKGGAFYTKALSGCKNESAQEIWKMLIEDERIHAERIKKIYDSINDGDGWLDEFEATHIEAEKLTSLFRKLAKKLGNKIKANLTDVHAMEVGIDLELKSVRFYEDALENAKEAKEKAFLELMIKEERNHYRYLYDMKSYLEDPSGWFRDKEHQNVDSGM